MHNEPVFGAWAATRETTSMSNQTECTRTRDLFVRLKAPFENNDF